MDYDIAIIGAGPAGATLARLLDRKYKILLVDKRNLLDTDRAPAKCCGGLLAPDAQQMLGRLGLAVPKDILVDPQLFLVRTIDFDNGLERYYQRFYFNMSRARFDAWLVSLAFKSAQALAVSLNEGLDDFQRRCRRRVMGLIASIAIKGAKNMGMYNKTLRGLVMRTGILSSDVYFHGL